MRSLKKGFMNPKRSIFVSVAILILVASIAYPQEVIKSATSLTVIDADGKNVGEVFGAGGGTVVVAFEFNKLVFLLQVKPTRFEGIGNLYFDNVNCTGNAFLSSHLLNETLIPYAVFYDPGRTLYLPDINSAPQTIYVQSDYSAPGTCRNYLTPSQYDGMLPAIPTVDFDNLFTPPFKLKAVKTKKIKMLQQ